LNGRFNSGRIKPVMFLPDDIESNAMMRHKDLKVTKQKREVVLHFGVQRVSGCVLYDFISLDIGQ
jgi:hypothetical protein